MPAAADTTRHGQLFDVLMDHAPDVRASMPCEAQRARRDIARALALSEDIIQPRMRMAVQRALFTVAADLGCAVCGKTIAVAELESCSMTRQSLVHLWGSCSDQFATWLGTTVDEALEGNAWL